MEEPDARLVMSTNPNDNCRFLRQQRDYEAREVKRYNFLILLVSISVVATLVGLIVAASLVKDQKAVLAAAGAVGTLVTGTAMAFVLKQRSGHQKLVAYWVRAVDRSCRDD